MKTIEGQFVDTPIESGFRGSFGARNLENALIFHKKKQSQRPLLTLAVSYYSSGNATVVFCPGMPESFDDFTHQIVVPAYDRERPTSLVLPADHFLGKKNPITKGKYIVKYEPGGRSCNLLIQGDNTVGMVFYRNYLRQIGRSD